MHLIERTSRKQIYSYISVNLNNISMLVVHRRSRNSMFEKIVGPNSDTLHVIIAALVSKYIANFNIILLLYCIFYMFRITTVASSESVINSTLRTYIIEKHINGMYICKASNILGTKEAVIIIHGKYWFLL